MDQPQDLEADPVPAVPEGDGRFGGALTAGDALRAVRAARWSFWTQAFARFRYGDGFSHARALALQLSLSFIPLVIAAVGLSGALATEDLGRVLRSTLLSVSPGGSGDLIRTTLEEGEGSAAALWIGLTFALATLTTAMGQVERGANRVYGIPRDRPSRQKYGRALGMTFAAGLPGMAGSGVLLAGAAFGDAVEGVYGWDDDVVMGAALPLAVLLVLCAVLAMLRLAPRRRQPGWSWLALGTVVAVSLWMAFTGLLAAYVQLSASFGVVYGPLTGVVALLLWTQLTSVAVLFGFAVTAQLEARHAGIDLGAVPDRASADLAGVPARPGADRRTALLSVRDPDGADGPDTALAGCVSRR
ncbi:YihY family inner membrane protein [Blastococcus aggregatus]|uniref:YihY family inner membrane protein n=1 Tax=Blastococcus aggregatus TaxID=38502 RepID=A0A285V7S0_9ACTN|nr:YihY/virulence factor BrkB family protein [Blastococcus aggregatus]SOC50063.1 YihY family inner membrane protein [Blastococcus aggregatus]